MTSFPVCGACNVPFKYRGPQPHLLPCLHAACSNCIDSDVDTSVPCCICQRSHDRSKQNFPVDQVVLADVLNLTSQQQPSEISCTNKEDGNQAVCWCEECSDFLCEHCHISHAEVKVTRNHKVWEVPDVSKTLKVSQARCIKHGLPMNIYDKDCDHFICSQCFYTNHSDHSTITSDEFARLEEQNLRENLKSVSNKKDAVLSSMANVNTHAKIVEDTSSRLRETVEHTFSELRSLIDQREKMVLLELEQLMECMRTSNNNRLPVLKSVDNCCQTTLDYIDKCLLYTSPQHILQFKSSIGEATQFCNKSDVPQVHKDESCVAFSKQGLQDMRSAISSFGSFLAPVEQTGRSQFDELTSFYSAKENSVKTTNVILQKQMGETTKTLMSLRGEFSKREEQIKKLKQDNARLHQVVLQIDPDGLFSESQLCIVKSENQMFVVKCPQMTLNNERVNLNRVHIDENGTLIYGGKKNGSKLMHLKKYSGTSCTSPLSTSGLIYWEVEADVNIERKLQGHSLILELAVCDERVMDKSHYMGDQSTASSLQLASGNEVGSDNVCIFVVENKKYVDVTQKVMPNEAGTVRKIRIGVLYDGVSQKVTFFDTTDLKIMGCANTPGKTAKLWAMFGIFHPTKKMELVSGESINMSPAKKRLLYKALHG